MAGLYRRERRVARVLMLQTSARKVGNTVQHHAPPSPLKTCSIGAYWRVTLPLGERDSQFRTFFFFFFCFFFFFFVVVIRWKRRHRYSTVVIIITIIIGNMIIVIMFGISTSSSIIIIVVVVIWEKEKELDEKMCLYYDNDFSTRRFPPRWI